MPLATINNGASSATARANINAAITGLNNASGPGVIYVTTSGNDTTGDGSLSKPYATALQAFYIVGQNAGLIKFGPGFFSVSGLDIGSPSVVVEGSFMTTLVINASRHIILYASGGIQINPTSTGANGSDGATGNSTDGNGQPGGNGEDAGDIIIIGDCKVTNPSSQGGNGGNGGGGIYYGDDGDGNAFEGYGGTGGNGGNSGQIRLRVTEVNGTVAAYFGDPGSGGVHANGNGNASNGNPGTFLYNAYIDGAYVVEAVFATGWGASRCTYYSAYPPTTDYGGNAIL
jgi:hypothetical protein